jgi:hypothetical protein
MGLRAAFAVYGMLFGFCGFGAMLGRGRGWTWAAVALAGGLLGLVALAHRRLYGGLAGLRRGGPGAVEDLERRLRQLEEWPKKAVWSELRGWFVLGTAAGALLALGFLGAR